jgi:hypothetical protein
VVARKKSSRKQKSQPTPASLPTRVRAKVKAGAAATGQRTAAILGAVVAGTLTAVLTAWVVPLLRPDDSSSDSAPLNVAVDKWLDRCTTNWFVPRPPDEIDFSAQPATTLPYDDPDAFEWPGLPVAAGGSSASPTEVIATVQGRTGTRVVLTDIDVRVHERRPAPAGTVLDKACGDPGAFRWLQADLDSDPPVVSPVVDEDAAEPGERVEPIEFPYIVSSTQPETFIIEAETDGCDCTWTARLVWQSEGRTGVVVIDDDGRPFRTISTREAIATCDDTGTCS